jgi:AcrR family transcriptional regulator
MRQRARKEEDKQARRRAILAAAARVWSCSSFEGFTMAEVARHARVAKGTVYLYFPSKESLLVELLEIRLEAWLVVLEARLARSRGGLTPDAGADLVASTLFADESLPRLLSILGSILELGLAEERVREFKGWLVHRLATTGAALERAMPFLGSHGVPFLLYVQVVLGGLGQFAHPAPVVARVLASPGFEQFRLDFEADLRALVGVLLAGFAAKSQVSRAAVGGTGRHRGRGAA